MRVEHWWYTIPLRLRSLFRRGAAEHDLDDELRDHVDQLTEQFRSRGLDADRARTEALRAMGGLERRKEEMRATRGVGGFESLLRDVRHAFRVFGRNPAFTVIAVLTLALGVGANTAIFTVVNSVLLQPLPYGHPDQLYLLQYQDQTTEAPGAFLAWRNGLHDFSAIGAAQFHNFTLTGSGAASIVRGLNVSDATLPMMQIPPLLGRAFTPDDMHDGHDRVVILSYAFWQEHFGGDPSAIGRAITLDGAPVVIVGVMPARFQFAPFWATHAEIFRPLDLDGAENDFDGASLRIFARIAPGVMPRQASHEIATFNATLVRDHPLAPKNAIIVPLADKVVGAMRGTLWMLLAAVALVLLIACANVTHLQLVRSSARARETAVRLSLGAGRGRLIQQALVESILLSAAGAVVGCLLAIFGIRLILHLAPAGLPRFDAVHLDLRVFVFLVVIALLAGTASGVAPALTATRVDPNTILAEAGRGSSGGRRNRRTGAMLVVSEFALAVVLLVGAGLVLRSVAAMLRVDTGFDPRGVLSMQVGLRATSHDSIAARGPFYQTVIDRVRTIPGVTAVSAINHLPLHGDSWRFSYSIDGRTVTTPDDQAHAFFRVIYPGYFAIMRIPIVEGRDFSRGDLDNRNHVVILDQDAARADWPGADPIGKRISVTAPGAATNWFTVIGVVKNVQQSDWFGAHGGEMYYPYWTGFAGAPTEGFEGELNPSAMTLVVRTSRTPLSARSAITAAIADLDRDVTVFDVITMNDAVSEQIAPSRFYLTLLMVFAIVALLLAAIGVYGVISHAVSARRREIGIRIALGAPAGNPLRMVILQGVRLASVGTVAGMVASLALTQYVRSLLFHVKPIDPVTYVAVPLLLIVVAALAAAVPGIRATKVDPVSVLQAE